MAAATIPDRSIRGADHEYGIMHTVIVARAAQCVAVSLRVRDNGAAEPVSLNPVFPHGTGTRACYVVTR